MNLNTDYAQLQALGEHDKRVEDMKLGLPPNPDVKPLDKVVDDIFKPTVITPKEPNEIK
jgi:hypothetical protein